MEKSVVSHKGSSSKGEEAPVELPPLWRKECSFPTNRLLLLSIRKCTAQLSADMLQDHFEVNIGFQLARWAGGLQLFLVSWMTAGKTESGVQLEKRTGQIQWRILNRNITELCSLPM